MKTNKVKNGMGVTVSISAEKYAALVAVAEAANDLAYAIERLVLSEQKKAKAKLDAALANLAAVRGQ